MRKTDQCAVFRAIPAVWSAGGSRQRKPGYMRLMRLNGEEEKII